jgi:hypothetical protein
VLSGGKEYGEREAVGAFQFSREKRSFYAGSSYAEPCQPSKALSPPALLIGPFRLILGGGGCWP